MDAISLLLSYGLKHTRARAYTHTHKTLACWQVNCYLMCTIHFTTETVLPNLSKYSHMLKDGINIIYSKPFTSDYMEWFPASLI